MNHQKRSHCRFFDPSLVRANVAALMAGGSIAIVTGAPGTGKSSAVRLLAETSPALQAVHLQTDHFYGFIAKGFVAPWLAEAAQQNRAVMDAIRDTALGYARGGFEVIVDGIIGPWFLEPWLACARQGVRVHYFVLRPDEATTMERGVSRRTPGALVDPEVIRNLWLQFKDLGAFEAHAVDSTAQSLLETAAHLRRLIEADQQRLGQ